MQHLCIVFWQEVHLYLKQEKSVFWVLFLHLNFLFFIFYFFTNESYTCLE